jgi:cation/acetate symporter
MNENFAPEFARTHECTIWNSRAALQTATVRVWTRRDDDAHDATRTLAMAFTSRTRLVNPRLGTYFGIFAAAFAAIVLMALMFEQLGVTDPMVRMIVFGCPIALYAALGLLSARARRKTIFACGRRVPAFFNGLALGIAALGGAGFLALTGCFFLIGFDALCLSIGWYAGLVFATLLFVPFLRKVGAYTVPTFLGRRFDSRTVRVVAAAVLSVPILLLLAAEARFAATLRPGCSGSPERLTAVLVVSCVAAIVIAGGMRSLTWSSAAQGIAALLALAVSATIVAVMVSNLPLPQMTHGNILRTLTRSGDGAQPAHHRRAELGGGTAGRGYRDAEQAHAAGVRQRRRHRLHHHVASWWRRASPLARACCRAPGTTPGVYEARKSGGWAVLVVGLVLLTLPADRGVSALVRARAGGERGPWIACRPGSSCLQQAGIASHRRAGPRSSVSPASASSATPCCSRCPWRPACRR